MRDGIDLTVRTEHWRDQERTAEKTARISKCGDGNVNLHTLAGKGRKLRRDHNGGDVLGIERRIVRIHAKPLQHADQALFGEDVARKRIASAVQADDQSVTDENVLAYAFDVDDIFDPGLRDCRISPRQTYRNQGQRKNDATHWIYCFEMVC